MTGRRLPPLNALRAFEAAARHLSFAKAAEELAVTPAAVSQQVRQLEDYLQVPLFRRLPRGLRITEAGRAALPELGQGFDALARGARTLAAFRTAGPLVISAAPSFAARWLIPRLDRFAEAHPEIDVRIDSTNRLVDFAEEDVDVAIRFGTGDYPGLCVKRLFPEREEVFPVCSPRLVDGPRPLRTPDDLRRHTLLHQEWTQEDDSTPNWRMWLLAAGVEDVDATRGPRFTQGALAIQAAIEGQGVALGSRRFVAEELAAGRLVQPFELSVCGPAEFSYYLVCAERTAARPKVQAFFDWAVAEAERRLAAAAETAECAEAG